MARAAAPVAAADVSLTSLPTADRTTVSFGPVARQPDEPGLGSGDTGVRTGQPEESGAPSGNDRVQTPDLDAIMDGIGDRLLREIERRGGRWAGTF